ncbi:MAG: hypothetical protein R3C53_03840 [Pirellulaceae bacterium]
MTPRKFDSRNFERDSFSERPFASALSSWGYAAFVVAVSGGLLLVNAILCLTVYAAMPKYESKEISSAVGQMFFYVAPLVLLVVEWNLLDRVQRLFQQDSLGK